jgi:hypothetical protein
MTTTARSLALALAFVAGGCFGGNKDKDSAGKESSGKVQLAGGRGPFDSPSMKALEGMKVVQPGERQLPDGSTVLTAGRIEATLPPGWAMMRLAGQTKYMAPAMGENMTVVAYSSEAALDGERQRGVIYALTELATKAEKVLGVFGAKVSMSPPQGARTAWGETSTFSAIGPLNRVAFHYAAVGAHEALIIQLDGNSEAGTPEHALALIKSVRYADAAPAAPPAK